MEIYLLSFVVFSAAFGGLALGVIAGRGGIRGSCGGLNRGAGLGSDCEICGPEGSRCVTASGLGRRRELQGRNSDG